MTTLAILLFAIIPRDNTIRESVDVLEHHFLYDERGREVFQQLIGWTTHKDGEHVQFWRLIKNESHIPQRDHLNGGYFVHFLDGERAWRYVRAPMFRERWTQYDVEVADRDLLPKEARRELRNK